MRWQSSLPAVETMAEWPSLVTDRKWCGACAARIASTAMRTLPSVPFLKPTGQERPDASSRCTWLSVVRAPMAPQRDQVGDVLRRDHVEELAARGQAELVEVEQELARHAQALVDVESCRRGGVVDQALPADGGARLLEVDAHDDQQIVRRTFFGFLQTAGVFLRRLDVVR